MPRSIEQQPEVHQEQSPRLELFSRWPNVAESLQQNKIFETLAPELKMPPEAFTNPEMLSALDQHLQNKIDSLNASLKDIGLEAINNSEDIKDPLSFALRLTQLVPELIKKEQRAHEEDTRPEKEKSNEVLNGVSEQYQFSGLEDIVAKARITGQPESYRQEGGVAPPEEPELPDQLQAAARKKVLVDMYVQGKSLNQLGHMYAYYTGTESRQHAPYRALADCLHLLNMATVFLMTEPGGTLAGALNAQMELSAFRLGRVELRKNQQGQFQMYSWGMTAAELSHEISKGLLEYATLDTSLPEAGTISKKEAGQLKSYLERPAIEMLELVYGAPLAKAVDQSMNSWLNDIRALHPSARGEAVSHLAKTLRAREQDILSSKRDRNLSLRLFKVLSGLPEEKLTEFYQYALKGKLPVDYWKQIQFK